MAMPAAAVTACCSAMPTSKQRSGNRSANGSSPVEPGMPAVRATISGRVAASAMSASLNAAVYEEPFPPTGTPVSGSKAPTSWRRFSSSLSAGR